MEIVVVHQWPIEILQTPDYFICSDVMSTGAQKYNDTLPNWNKEKHDKTKKIFGKDIAKQKKLD